jgi:hypothetical protein
MVLTLITQERNRRLGISLRKRSRPPATGFERTSYFIADCGELPWLRARLERQADAADAFLIPPVGVQVVIGRIHLQFE